MENKWLLANSNQVNTKEEDDEEEEVEEETLSLVDFPQVQCSKTEEKQNDSHEEFNFCRSLSSESEMCSADEIFFQGQIMPLRMINRNVSRTESMDRYYSGALFSSRSSSLSSSSCSGNSTATLNRRQPKAPRNLFHSHPSPSPRLNKQGTFYSSNLKCNKKSSMWSVLSLGLVTPPPEIALQDFKPRYHIHKSNNTGGNVKSSEKKHALFGTGCKCSVDSVATISSNIVLAKEREPPTVQPDKENVTRRKKMTKKQISHRRTFEWLRQLSVEGEREEA